MAELILGPSIGALLSMVKEKASSYLLEQYEVMEGMEEQHEILLRKLPAIMDVIADADEQAAQREGAKAWLQALKKVAYQANEAFDEFQYEALRRKASEANKLAVTAMCAVKLCPPHKHDDAFRYRMGNKLHKIVQSIEVLVAEMNAFGFKFQSQKHAPRQWRQTYHNIFDPAAKIAQRSRDRDIKQVVGILLDQPSNEGLKAVSIVGMGGLGKTTLAQLVYNDPQVEKHFQLRLWVCVSDTFDVDSLAKKIVETAGSNNVELPNKIKAAPSNNYMDYPDTSKVEAISTKSPLDRLQELVSARRFLLVLDDVWRTGVTFSDKWENIRASLYHGAIGSAVLITTRDGGVAEAMGIVEAYNLTELENIFLEEIIMTRAFSMQKEIKTDLAQMVGEVAKRCVGSPLAATALGSVLRTKTSVEEWKAVISKSTICDSETGILPILKLSYYDLPSHMKQSFAFCAVFPKDYEIDVDKMIQLWMANDLIPMQEGVRPETMGKWIFNELASRSFFQDIKQVPDYDYDYRYLSGYRLRSKNVYCFRKTCKIHDLMHDVAQSVMLKECVIIGEEPSQMDDLCSNAARHLFLPSKKQDTLLNYCMRKMSPAIQTLLCGETKVPGPLHHPSKYSSMRALQLCQCKSTFLLKPKHLHQLRYLDLSNSFIKALPEDISILYNLQTLNLSGCYRLCQLPRQMKNMNALHHLYTYGCSGLKFMPPGIRRLTSLQTLTNFVVGTGANCSNLEDLQHLVNLSGHLELEHLENVREADTKVADLINKQELRGLTLSWSSWFESRLEDTCYDLVLHGFKPNNGLKALNIHFYPGTTFPSWVFQLKNVVELCLDVCKKVEQLPSLWKLPHLQLLTLRGLHKIKFLWVGDASYAFPKLKELNLISLSNFERWWEIDGRQGEEMVFPELEELMIQGCDKLSALPEANSFNWAFPKLKVFMLGGNSLKSWGVTERTDLDNVEQSPLSIMEFSGCSFFFRSPTLALWKSFGQLQDLSINNCNKLVHWPENEFESLVSLKKLSIRWCYGLTGYAQLRYQPTSGRRQLLPHLESLQMYDCHSLVEIFEVPMSLKTMKIFNCNKLKVKFREHVASSEGRDQVELEAEAVQHDTDIKPATVVPKQLPSPTELYVPCLENLDINMCHGISKLVNLPKTLKEIDITYCPNIELLSGQLDSLQKLTIIDCHKLGSLEIRLGEHPSLKSLTIKRCPQIKSLPECLQQRLDSLEERDMDTRFEGPRLSKPQTWKYQICHYRKRLVK